MATKGSEVAAQSVEILREYGPFGTGEQVHGVTYDGTHVWYAAGERLQAVDPAKGGAGPRLSVAATAGTAFDGRHFYQIAGDAIQKVDAKNGQVLSTIPTPAPAGQNSGLTWAEGTLWVGQYHDRSVVQVDPDTGRILKRIPSARFVTGVTFVEGDLWYGTWEDEVSDLRRVDATSGEVLERLAMPAGTSVTGIESDGGDVLFCGGGSSGKIRAIRRPRR